MKFTKNYTVVANTKDLLKNNFMKNILFFLTVVSLVALLSCSKKRGCNIDYACNFDPSAEKYDESCTFATQWYKDSNGDGNGDPEISLTQCDQPDGYVANANGTSGPTATDFNVVDCDGVSHHLFGELDAGKIIVIAWIMPCTSCITDPLNAHNIVQTYASTHPGRVVMYIADDYANTVCSTVVGWSNFYGMTNSTKFSDPAITMSDYGVDGMPKIVVLGGSNHKVYYNENSSSAGIGAAIDQALIDNP